MRTVVDDNIEIRCDFQDVPLGFGQIGISDNYLNAGIVKAQSGTVGIDIATDNMAGIVRRFEYRFPRD